MPSSKIPNARLSAWLNAMKRFKIIPGQKELSQYVLTQEGNPMKQEYLSLIKNGRRTLSDDVLHQIIKHFSFLDEKFIKEGEGEMVESDKLLRWVLEKKGITQASLAEFLDIPPSTLNKLRNHHQDGEWDPIWNYLNHETGYNISLDGIIKANKGMGASKVFVAKNEETKRFLEMVDAMKRVSKVKDDKDFAEKIGVSPNMIYNMRNETSQQSVTIKMLKSTIKIFPRVSANYILNKEGDMFLNGGSAFGIMADIRADQLQQSDIMRKQSKDLQVLIDFLSQKFGLLINQDRRY